MAVVASVPPVSVGPSPPDDADLHAAALSHLARYGATRATLLRVLDRRIDRWAGAAREAGAAEDLPAAVAAARRAAREVVARLVQSGAVNDAAFAQSRARRLQRTGRSRRATLAHLAARGVTGEAAQGAVPADPEAEFAAAVAFLRRRRFGPFRAGATEADAARRELAALARAGFAAETARRALALTRDEAEVVLAELRRV